MRPAAPRGGHGRPAVLGRQVHAVGRVPAEQLPAAVHVAQARAARGPVQGEVLVAAQQFPVQPGDLVRRAGHPLAARG